MKIQAKRLKDHHHFHKVNGSVIYKVMSESSRRHYGLKEGRVYGISLDNGNMTDVDAETEVIRVRRKKRQYTVLREG